MSDIAPVPVSITLPDAATVSGLLLQPPAARALYVFAHGAGASMTHPFMAAMADGLAARGVATLRYQFRYMEQKRGRPDSSAVAQATVRAAVAEAARRCPELPLVAGGKSFGGRMTSQAQAESPLPGVRGLMFLGFPLHPAKRPAADRATHLAAVRLPMLFLQGTRDALAEMPLIAQVVASLGRAATLAPIAEADHSFHVPARSGRSDADALEEVCDIAARWMLALAA